MKLVGVEKTMIFPLLSRYSESIKLDGIINDNKSIEIVEKMKLDSSIINKIDDRPLTKLACITRAFNVDYELQKILKYEKEATVLCIGCGLESTYYRCQNNNFIWYDIDLPNVIDVRKKFFAEEDNCKMISKSILDEDTFQNIEIKGTTIVIALGLLYYFDENQVKSIIENISSSSQKTIIIMDYFSKQGVDIVNEKVLKNNKNTKMTWYANNEKDLMNLNEYINVKETYPLYKKVKSKLSDSEMEMTYKSDKYNINSMAIIEINHKK